MLVLAGAVGAAALVGAVIGGLIVHVAADSDSGNTCAARAVADTGLPSMVTVSASDGAASGTGSGELIRSGGYILTNNHVISVAAADGGSVSVLYSSGHSSAATIVGRDPDTDLAVLKASDGFEDLPLITIGSSDSLVVGQPVVALGSPLGLSSTVTAGIVSALNRYVPVPGDEGGLAHLVGAVQTDAAINPGNSGGALVDCDTRLVGINTAIATVPNSEGVSGGGSVGLGFAIPVDMAMPIADDLIEHGAPSHPTFGMEVQTIPPSLAAEANVSPGLYVEQVAAGGPAAEAGIKAGDIVTKVDGAPATSADALVVAVLTSEVGDQITLDYERDGQPSSATVTLAASR
jgi:putative serine protease PepD